MTEALLRLPEVTRLTGLSRMTILRRVDDGTFPVPRRAGVRLLVWLQSEVTDWMRALPAAEKPRRERDAA